MSVDTAKLKELAENYLRLIDSEDHDIWAEASDAYDDASDADTVLALIAENEKLKADLREVKDAKLGLSWAIGEIMGERDQLKAERDEFMESQGRRMDVLRNEHGIERDQLKAECEGLRKARVPAGLYRELVALRELRDQAKAYVDGYLLDEVEDIDNCISEDQHLSASALSERLMDSFQAHWDSAMGKGEQP